MRIYCAIVILVFANAAAAQASDTLLPPMAPCFVCRDPVGVHALADPRAFDVFTLGGDAAPGERSADLGGAIAGAFTGALVGGLVGGLLAHFLSSCEDTGEGPPCGLGTFYGAVGGAVFGAVIGAVIGATAGGEPDAPDPDSPNDSAR